LGVSILQLAVDVCERGWWEIDVKECKRSEQDEQQPKLGGVEKGFRTLWPGKSGDWREEWKSFALGGLRG
jgi:hypothetical protein